MLFGVVPQRRLDASPDAVARQLEGHGIRRGLACSLRGALFDVRSGNDETRKTAAEQPGFVPVGAVDLRDALGAEDEIARLAEAGVKLLRLFPVEQDGGPSSRAARHPENAF